MDDYLSRGPHDRLSATSSLLSPLPFGGTDRFRPIALIGRGSMGAVYRVRDHELGIDVALKTLERLDAEQVYRLKQEFRSLAGIVHPNLVYLHELVVTDDMCFFTMEFIDGVDFVNHVRAESSHGTDIVQRFLVAALQVVDGLMALHALRRLHRDVKPSNVCVSTSGRVVLLDLGLAARLEAGGARDTMSHTVAGTYAYMPPEQAWGRPLTTAADWYATGVMFYEALAGQLPFDGALAEVLQAKTASKPRRLSAVTGFVPDWLDDVIAALLDPDAPHRPDGHQLRETLRRRHGTTMPRPSPSAASDDVELIGRERELDELRNMLAATSRGERVVGCVEGVSGIGKTELLRRFLGESERAGTVVALRGRCHPHESVPYKALDTIVDELSRFLVMQPDAAARALLPRHLPALVRLFPVLGRVPLVSESARTVPHGDSVEVRRLGVRALRELLGRITDSRLLVMWIDDLQWGDPDSTALIIDLLRPPDAPAFLLLASFRSEDRHHLPLLRALDDLVALVDGPRVLTIEVGPLENADALRLAYDRSPPEARSEARIAAITAESAGSPFLISAIARSSGFELRASDGSGSAVVADVIGSLVRAQPDAAQHVLQLVAVAGEPIERSIVLRVAGPGDATRAMIDLLESRSLLRTTTVGDALAVETYHDRIRDSVVRRLTPATLVALNRDLAIAFEASGLAEPEALARYFHGAGELAKAAGYALAAADKASDALAFVRAAELYHLAREWDPRDVTWTRVLLTREADALVNAAHFVDAARLYLAAVDGASSADALELRRCASEQLLAGGRIDEGVATLRGLLTDLGVGYPRTPRHAMVTVALRVAHLFLRRIKPPRPTSPGSGEALDLARVDTCHSAAKSLSHVDPMRGLYFSLEGLRHAFSAGDPVRLGRSLGVVGASLAGVGGKAVAAKGAAMVRVAEAIAAATGSPELRGTLDVSTGQTLMLSARWKDALARSDTGVTLLTERCRGYVFECNIARASAMRSLEELGAFADLAVRAQELMDAAAGVGNSYAELAAATHLVLTRLAADDLPGARRLAGRDAELWTRTGYHLQHLYSLRADAFCELYDGDATGAFARLIAAWPKLRGAGLLRIPLARVDALALRSRLAVCRALHHPSEHATLLRAAERDTRRLSREARADAAVHARMLEATIAAQRRDFTRAITSLDAAISLAKAADMPLYAATARRRKGTILGGTAGAELVAAADDVMQGHGVVRPDRWTELYLPGCTTPS
jgi:hypothetical protein